MAGFLIPLIDQLRIVTAMQLPYKTGLLKLFKEAIVFDKSLDAAALAAIEADFTGYSAITLTTLPVPYADPNHGGISFQIPTQQWNTSATPTVLNNIYGGWIEDAGGLLLMAWQISNPVPMEVPHRALVLDQIVNQFGSNQVYISINGTPQ